MRRVAALLPLFILATFAFAGVPGHVLAKSSTPNKVIDYETIVGSLNSDGSLHRVRLLDDLRMFGQGNVTVVDPSGTHDVRNLLGYSGPNVQGSNLVYHVSNLDGSKQFLTVSTPQKLPPLSMGVRYTLDGRNISGPDLVGKTGDVKISFMVRNTTARTQTVTYRDATGGTQTTQEQVAIPIVAQLQLTLPPAHFTKLDTPNADVFTDPFGNSIVNWSMVMVPPIGTLTQTFTLEAQANDFRLGQVRLSGAPVAPNSRQFLSYAETQLGAGVDAASGLFTGANQIAANLDTLHAGTLQLVSGLEKLFAGSQLLTTGLNKAFTGSGQLTTGLNKAASGSGQLTAGLTKLENGSGQLTSGLGQAVAGVGKPTDGPTSLAGGLSALKRGLAQILGGLEQIKGGLPTAKDQLLGLKKVAQTYGTLLSAAAQACAADPSGYCSTNVFTSGLTIHDALSQAATCLSGLGVSDCASQVPSIATITGLLAAGLDQAVAGLGDKGNSHSLIGGTAAAIAGVAKLLAGAQTLRTGLEKAYSGSGKITAGLGLAHTGSQQLTSGLAGQAAPGSQQLTTGLGQAATGSGKISGGLGKAKGGGSQIEQGVYAINELGVKEVARSANDTAIQIGQQLGMLKAEDQRVATSSLLYGPPSSNQAKTVIGGSGVVLVMDELDGRVRDTEVRNIFVGIGLLLMLGLTLLSVRGMRRVAAA